MATTNKKGQASISITPLGDLVVVKPLSREDVSPSGIIIPDTASREKPEQGKVVAVGPGKYENGAKNPMTLKVGDTVLFSKYVHNEVKVDGIEYLILHEYDVLAVLES